VIFLHQAPFPNRAGLDIFSFRLIHNFKGLMRKILLVLFFFFILSPLAFCAPALFAAGRFSTFAPVRR